ncbi:MBL fold metallo-hydrolase [Psychromarinibacter sp. C21-152]|uniref:MBL fold metallo-hydrolase n=1 Tax=Psychromarinibacter sediminicola TaxID=3033385 RepID=A0AAE3T9P6_9RHOB|nr:MBL fold metallo-hydrolase [Psychromarinibacter sediminicola]MDF0602018.1 MBL fold metallo-hydrolase [Psychromarinibacter sediminicola]
MKRRDFLTSSALAATAGLAGLRVAPVLAQDGAAGLAVARSFPVGDRTVTALSDGFLPIAADALIGITPEEFATLLADAHISADAHPTGVNAYLIEGGGETVLVDVGTGTAMGPSLGHVLANLTAFGTDPAEIDRLVATHLHPDHIGGLLGDGGNPFPNAGLVTQRAEVAFWSDDSIRDGAPEGVRGFFDMARAAVAAFGDRVETVDGETDLGNGLTLMPLPGHTPGHSGVMLESAGDSLLIWGDIVHVGPVQFPRPEVTIGFDTDKEMAAATRAKVFDMVATDGLRIAGMHIGFPGIGYVEKGHSGYGFTPAPFPYG